MASVTSFYAGVKRSYLGIRYVPAKMDFENPRAETSGIDMIANFEKNVDFNVSLTDIKEEKSESTLIIDRTMDLKI